MDFFKSVYDLLSDGQQLAITVRRKLDELVVSVMPDVSGVKDKAVENIVPIVINGKPDEFDEGFADALKTIPHATGLVTNIREYEESVEMAKKATEMAKKEKEDKDKAKKEFDGYIALARQNLKENKFVDAKKCIEKAAAVKDADKALIDKARKAIAEKSGEGGLFQGPVDMSDGKNITLGKDFKPKVEAPKTEDKPVETKDAFKEDMELDDNDENNDENQEEE